MIELELVKLETSYICDVIDNYPYKVIECFHKWCVLWILRRKLPETLYLNCTYL